MNIRYLLVWLVALLFAPIAAHAACPVQETAILYLNGVDTTGKSAEDSARRLGSEISKVPGVQVECVIYDYVYNTNEPLFADFLEAAIQKADEFRLSLSDFWRFYFRITRNPLLNPFPSLIPGFYHKVNYVSDLGRFVLGDQSEEHLAKYREHLAAGRQVILVAHSQGNLYANEEWLNLSPGEQDQVRVIAVATPADTVARNGPYTTLEEDGVAKFLFPFALPANAANEESCDDDWTCHGFKESYLHGTQSRTRIVDQIVGLLPMPIVSGVEGIVRVMFVYNGPPLVGADVQLLDYTTEEVVSETKTDTGGHYQFMGVSAGKYYLVVYYQGQFFDYSSVVIEEGKVKVVNFPIPRPM